MAIQGKQPPTPTSGTVIKANVYCAFTTRQTPSKHSRGASLCTLHHSSALPLRCYCPISQKQELRHKEAKPPDWHHIATQSLISKCKDLTPLALLLLRSRHTVYQGFSTEEGTNFTVFFPSSTHVGLNDAGRQGERGLEPLRSTMALYAGHHAQMDLTEYRPQGSTRQPLSSVL